MNAKLTPSAIVEELNRYIVGQQDAKKAVAIALRNRWRRLQAPTGVRDEIMPNNILMIGATGVGKTEIARRLATLADAPFVKVEASKFTEVGYVGRDVESMVRDLTEQSVNMTRAAHKEACRVQAQDAAEQQIIDILIPPTTSGTADEVEQNASTREKFKHKLRAGELDHREIEIEVTVQGTHVQVMSPPGMEGMEGLQELMNQMAPKKRKNRKVKVAEAREILIEEEASRLIDMETVVREALDKAQHSGIIFIDEIDKIAGQRGKGGGGPDVSREGVQRDLLPVVEGCVVNTKYGPVNTDHVLFISAGAFHLAKPSDLIPELQGRFPIRVELQPLTRDDFVKILTVPKGALSKQYQALLASEGAELVFEPEAIDAIADFAFQLNQENENIGARRLHTVVSNLLDDILFTVPDLDPSPSFRITSEFVAQKLARLVQKKDLGQFIL